jgi:diguanylate cyclase (GGDEF)-like protein
MSRRAWAYICGVLILGMALTGFTFPIPAQSPFGWLTFAALTMLATVAQQLKVDLRNRQSYFATLVFIFAGVLLLHPALFALLVIISYTIEWAKERLMNSPLLRDWYIQPFNIATHVIAGLAAQAMYGAFGDTKTLFQTPMAVLAVALAALTYVICNHLLIGLALVLARGLSLRDSGILDVENLLTDLVLLCLGYTMAVLWTLNPWLVLPALAPLVLMYRALRIPLLKKEAQTDAKTGLLNAGYFTKLFEAELARARRFNRPLALIMADLDLLRNINNSYGHLAGDIVLAGVGQVIRQSIRDYDIAGRFGGEEFLIVLPETGPREAQEIAERLRVAIASERYEVRTSSVPIHATMSLGVACFPEDAAAQKDLVHAADVAVYQAKINGRNRVVCAADLPPSIGLADAPPDERETTVYPSAFTVRQAASEHQAPEKPADNGARHTGSA